MIHFLARRFLRAAAVVALAVTAGFALAYAAPGDALTGDGSQVDRSAAATAVLRTRLGLDQPFAVQYAQYLARAVHGDLGTSRIEQRPVSALLGEALAGSLLLSGTGLLLAVLVGLVIGSAEGWWPRLRTTRAAGTMLTALYVVPEFVLAITLIGVLAHGAGWFPTGGMADPVISATGWPLARALDVGRHLCLPALTLALAWGAAVARQQRAALAQTAGEPFVRTARAKGRGELAVLLRHALPPAVTPVLTVVGLLLPALAGGAAIVEVVFAWPGMGTLVLRAVGQRDVPVLAGAIVVIATVVAASSLLVEVAIRLMDPRQRLTPADA